MHTVLALQVSKLIPTFRKNSKYLSSPPSVYYRNKNCIYQLFSSTCCLHHGVHEICRCNLRGQDE